VLIVAEEAFGDATCASAERGREVEDDAADDDFGGQDFGSGQNFGVFIALI